MTPLLRKFLGMHWILFATMIGMIAFGIVSIHAAVHFRDGDLEFLRTKWNDQLRFSLLGLIGFFVAAMIDYKWVKWGALPMYFGGLALLLLVQRHGVEIHGSKSWLRIAGIQFQPSQMAICCTILLVAVVLSEGQRYIPILRYHFLRLVAAGLFFGGVFVLILMEGDLGSAMVLGPVVAAMLLAGGIAFRYLIAGLLIVLAVLPMVYFFKLKDFQQERIDVTWKMFLGKTVNVQKEAYAANNILIAVGSGGLDGKGTDPRITMETTKSMTHLGKVPAITSHDDFIFAVVAETFGFRGGALLILGFLFLLLMALTVALFSRDVLGRLIVVGVIGLLFGHSFEHIGMNIGLLPITGIPLPFISYGGTFLLVVMFLFGMMQSVWIHRNKMIEEPVDPHQRGARPAKSLDYED